MFSFLIPLGLGLSVGCYYKGLFIKMVFNTYGNTFCPNEDDPLSFLVCPNEDDTLLKFGNTAISTLCSLHLTQNKNLMASKKEVIFAGMEGLFSF